MNLRPACRQRPADPVVAAGHDAEQTALAVPSAVTAIVEWPVLALIASTSSQGGVRGDIRVGSHESGLVLFHLADHFRLALDALRRVDERQAAASDRAMAIPSSDTACMTADTRGMLIERRLFSSPLR